MACIYFGHIEGDKIKLFIGKMKDQRSHLTSSHLTKNNRMTTVAWLDTQGRIRLAIEPQRKSSRQMESRRSEAKHELPREIVMLSLIRHGGMKCFVPRYLGSMGTSDGDELL